MHASVALSARLSLLRWNLRWQVEVHGYLEVHVGGNPGDSSWLNLDILPDTVVDVHPGIEVDDFLHIEVVYALERFQHFHDIVDIHIAVHLDVEARVEVDVEVGWLT